MLCVSWSTDALSSVEVYDRASGQWTEAAPLTALRNSGHSCVALEGKLWVTGGYHEHYQIGPGDVIITT